MKCKDCNCCNKGYFKSKPDDYICTGAFVPFVIKDINNECTEYDDLKEPELWSWNEIDSDTWTHGTFDTKEEAIQDALDCINYVKRIQSTDNPTIYIGKCEYIPLRTDVDPDMVMEYLDELYGDESGCDYYIYEDVTDEQRKWLEDKLSDVMYEFHKKIGLNSCWFRVVEQEEIEVKYFEFKRRNKET